MLLCGPSKNVLCDMEERFWNSICRLKNALCCGRVLPGAGVPEIACIRRLTGRCFDSCISVVPEHPSGEALQNLMLCGRTQARVHIFDFKIFLYLVHF